MEQSQIEVFREMLAGVVTGSERFYRTRDEIAIETSADPVDQVDDAARREVAAQRLDFHARRSGDVTAALQRMQEGTYGTCLACDSQISVNRLKAVPWARYCLNCQEMADRDELWDRVQPRTLTQTARQSAR